MIADRDAYVALVDFEANGAVIMGRDGIRDYMAYCAELTQKYPDRFIGNFTLNPRFGPEESALELEFHVKEYGFKMLKLHSNMHNYRPDRALDWLRPAMKMCAKHNVVVLIHTGDGPYSIPTQFYPVIREFPMVSMRRRYFLRCGSASTCTQTSGRSRLFQTCPAVIRISTSL